MNKTEVMNVNCLIVDDEPRICYGLQELIDWESLGVMTRDTAFSAREAIEMHRANNYALIVTDIKMPITDGLSMIAQIRAFDPNVFFIIVSGYEEFQYARTALKYGVSDYILKPVDEELLYEQVRQIAEKLGALPRAQSGSKASSVDFAAIRQYVDEHFCESISLQEVAQRFYVNQAYLGRTFRANTGKKFSDYVNDLRISRAVSLLRDRTARVQDVCLMVGYKDINYFYKKFKELTGKLPSDYR